MRMRGRRAFRRRGRGGTPLRHRLLRSPVCEARPRISARGPPACLQAAGPPGISSRDSLAALNAMPGVQVPRPYSVSGADGRSWYPGEGKASAGGRVCGIGGGTGFRVPCLARSRSALRGTRPSFGGPGEAGSRDSLAALNAMPEACRSRARVSGADGAVAIPGSGKGHARLDNSAGPFS